MQNTQDYPTTENNNNINNVGTTITNPFMSYFLSPVDNRFYFITCSELKEQEILIYLNNGINPLSHIPNNNENIQNTYTNTYKFYFHSPVDNRFYLITYSELNESEILMSLNNGINPLYHIPDYNLQLMQQAVMRRQYFNTNYTYNTLNGNSYEMRDRDGRYGISELP
jgi:hypothetical protein